VLTREENIDADILHVASVVFFSLTTPFLCRLCECRDQVRDVPTRRRATGAAWAARHRGIMQAGLSGGGGMVSTMADDPRLSQLLL